MPKKSMTVGIAGAGVMGRVLAWQLLQAGYTVSIFDKDEIDFGNAAAYTAAGMLTPYCEVESAELMVYDLGKRSLQLWDELANELNGDLGYFKQGSLIVAHGADQADYDQFNQQVLHKLRPTSEQYRELNRQQLTELEPELSSQFSQAIYLPEEAWLSPAKTLKLLAERLIDGGVSWYPSHVILSVKSHIIATTEGEHHFDLVIDCRGLGAKSQWPEIRGVRGEIIWLRAPDVNINHLVRLMHPRYRLYLVPRGYDDLYIVGATQIESNDMGPMTVRSSLELLSAAYSLHSGFAEARIVDMRTNCRPALDDNLPKIELSDGLIRINGLFRHGFLLSPALGEQVLSHIENSNYQSDYETLINRVA
jgi:glycine oxidase